MRSTGYRVPEGPSVAHLMSSRLSQVPVNDPLGSQPTRRLPPGSGRIFHLTPMVRVRSISVQCGGDCEFSRPTSLTRPSTRSAAAPAPGTNARAPRSARAHTTTVAALGPRTTKRFRLQFQSPPSIDSHRCAFSTPSGRSPSSGSPALPAAPPPTPGT